MPRTSHLIQVAACAAMVLGAAAPALVQQGAAPAPAQTPATTQGPAGRGTGAGPGQGQGLGGGRAFQPIQEYPPDPNTVIQALHGFKVEIVAKADRATQGSWISVTEDDQA